jgi:subtilase family serine protease
VCPRLKILVILIALALWGLPLLSAQRADLAKLRPLANHHPLWANAGNDVGLVTADQPINQLTLVLARTPERQAALEQFLADQQNPASPDYHHWLTPAEVGERFGLADSDTSAITDWLRSQGLHVDWVAPSKIFIGFSGAAADVSRAFHAELHNYRVNGRTASRSLPTR